MDNSIENFYNKYSTKQVKKGVNLRHKTIHAKLVENGLSLNSNVLEIGCGIGTVSQLIAKTAKQGTIKAVDLSADSIKIAKNSLEQFKNIEFIHGDIITMDIQGNFDLIVLPDVIEHIPLEQHKQLFKKISNLLNSKGKICINIPDPYYLEWCHIHRKENLQIIDQPIYTNVLSENIDEAGLRIVSLESYGLWIKPCDYQFVILASKVDHFEDILFKPTFIKKVRFKIKKMLSR